MSDLDKRISERRSRADMRSEARTEADKRRAASMFVSAMSVLDKVTLRAALNEVHLNKVHDLMCVSAAAHEDLKRALDGHNLVRTFLAELGCDIGYAVDIGEETTYPEGHIPGLATSFGGASLYSPANRRGKRHWVQYADPHAAVRFRDSWSGSHLELPFMTSCGLAALRPWSVTTDSDDTRPTCARCLHKHRIGQGAEEGTPRRLALIRQGVLDS